MYWYTKYLRNENRRHKKVLTSQPPKNHEFIGRREELNEIEKRLEDNNSLILLNGLGGLGKTELAKEFFHSRSYKYDYIGWIEYNNDFKKSIISSVYETNLGLDLHSEETIESKYKKIISKILNLSKKTLFIIDNFDNPNDQSIKEFNGHNINVLVTSRYKIENFIDYEIGYLTVEECIRLFSKYCGNQIYEVQDIEDIIKLAGYHTLTIELIARTIKASGRKIKEIYELLKVRGFNLSETIKEKTGILWQNDKEKRNFIEHLKVVFDISNLDEEEKYVLINLSVLQSTMIKKIEIKEWLKLESLDSVNNLVEKGWIREYSDCIEIHNVIQEVTREYIKPEYEKIKNLINSMTKLTNTNNKSENPILKKKYVEHGVTILKYCWGKNNNLICLSNNVSAIYQAIGDLKNSLEYSKESVKMGEDILENNNPNLATLYNNLSTNLKINGKYDEALSLAKKALKIREESIGINHPQTASSYNNIGSIYQDMKDYTNSLEYAKKSLKIRKEVLKENHPDLATSYNNIGNIYNETKNYLDALKYLIKSNEIYQKVLEKNHPNLATSYNNISAVYKSIGDLTTAMEYAKKALEIRETSTEKNNPNLAFIYFNIGDIYFRAEKYTESTEYFEKSISIMKINFPEGHPKLDIFQEGLYKSREKLEILNLYQLKLPL